MRVKEINGKDGQSTTILSISERKTSIELWYFFKVAEHSFQEPMPNSP